jgi:hypothetical protein
MWLGAATGAADAVVVTKTIATMRAAALRIECFIGWTSHLRWKKARPLTSIMPNAGQGGLTWIKAP